MSAQLEDLRDKLNAALEQLIKERDTALQANEPAKVATAEAEAERLGTVVATVQFAINSQVALNLNAVAARLQESIEAQKAVGLSLAWKTIEKAATVLKDAGATAGTVLEAVAGSMQAKPGKFQSVVNKLIEGAKAKQLDPMLVLTIVAIESDFNPLACSSLSSAAGLFQFLDSTWFGAGGEEFPGRGGKGNGHAAGASVDVQVAIGCKFIADIRKALAKRLGTEPSVAAIYMAHQQGLGGALKILKADPNAAIESVIGEAAARNNAFDGLRVGQTIEKFRTMVRTNEDQARELVVAAAPAVGGGASVDVNTIAARVVHVALTEMEMFARDNGRIVVETQPPLNKRVLEYFSGVGRPDITDPSAEAWSAAFISFVMGEAMRRAGVGQDLFPKSAAHATYILAGLANRIANRLNAPLVYFDRGEMAPRVGDLVGFSRTGKVKNRADIEALLPDKFFPSHTDLVVDVSAGRIKVIGGNVGQTIKLSTVAVDGEGRIDPSDQHFFVLRVNI